MSSSSTPAVTPGGHSQEATAVEASPFSDWDKSGHAADSPQISAHTSSSETGDGDIVPPYHPARTLVLCFDGTGDQFNTDNSNVVKFFSMLKKDDRREQMVYYQSGIGTYTTPQVASPLQAKIDKLLDDMVAWNLSSHVQSGYEFIMQNYQAGDKICLFGFSRGAYTARALAGMIHKVGLLPACNHQQVPFAYKMFTRDDDQGWKQSNAFKKAFSIDVDIDFIGVWDTVSSVGIIPHTLPFTSSNTAIRVFRHALSLDEHRSRFQANLYQHPTQNQAARGTKPGDMPKRDIEYATRVGVRQPPTHERTTSEYQKQRAQERAFDNGDASSDGSTNVLEVWFAGCHCDVGGGSVDDSTPHTLARIPLRWMIRECFKMNTGIRFHGELLRRVGLDPAALHPVVLDRPPALRPQPDVHLTSVAPPVPHTTEEEHEVRDALMPLYDQLALAPYWWVLEVLPIKHRWQGPAPDHKQMQVVSMNLGRGRVVPKHHEPFYVHRSVKLRMEMNGGKYVPKAQYVTEPIWVD
ncbi:hypothetical protein C2E23DRAFT_883906 [Lenzites betulinus]|nr:hypothetical protein C2E23DRAFT_883906 [Lenzites betulinus]